MGFGPTAVSRLYRDERREGLQPDERLKAAALEYKWPQPSKLSRQCSEDRLWAIGRTFTFIVGQKYQCPANLKVVRSALLHAEQELRNVLKPSVEGVTRGHC